MLRKLRLVRVFAGVFADGDACVRDFVQIVSARTHARVKDFFFLFLFFF